MIEDRRIRGMGEKAQAAHIRAILDFAAFLGAFARYAHARGTAGLSSHMAETGVTPSTFNMRILALRLFFGMTCGREDMERFMQFRTERRPAPVGWSGPFPSS